LESDKITSEDVSKAEIVSSGKPRHCTLLSDNNYGNRFLLYYGKYCGPGTDLPGNPSPQDSLDLCCKLHDTYFFKTKNVDYALAESVQLLLKKNMITQPCTRM
jgi:hypothetical protein